MNKLSSLLLMVVMFATISCDELINIKFTTNPTDFEVVIQPLSSGDFFESTENIQSSLKEEVEKKGGSMDQIDEIIINSIKVTILSGAENFDAIQDLEVSIVVDGMDTIKLAWENDIPLNVSELTPEINTEDLKDFITLDNYKITSKGLLREDTGEVITLKVKVDYEVTI